MHALGRRCNNKAQLQATAWESSPGSILKGKKATEINKSLQQRWQKCDHFSMPTCAFYHAS